ncbi:hypothetical protein HaLaN_07089 [Haematococcus lacustris]|uniref:Uncharacterized protein n=1 Tax=Haematococcus lacustris TaxID=44745 RepID=A0A699YNK7_HAELA|nr:hypothetical protein HaLaN_07089 [Haematococcus lacustris]
MHAARAIAEHSWPSCGLRRLRDNVLRRGGGRGLGHPEGTIAVAEDNLITTYDFEGNMRDHVAVQGNINCMACLSDGRLIFIADDTMYMANLRAEIEDDFVMVFVAKQLVSHVKPSGGLALMHAAKKLLFISSRNSLCELDIESKESRVITESMEAGRLCSGTDKSALFISLTSSGSLYLTPCSMEGILDLERKIMLPATTTDCCVNSQGGLLMLEKPGKDKLARLCLMRGLLPCSEA